jgi:hypothetical protein
MTVTDNHTALVTLPADTEILITRKFGARPDTWSSWRGLRRI